MARLLITLCDEMNSWRFSFDGFHLGRLVLMVIRCVVIVAAAGRAAVILARRLIDSLLFPEFSSTILEPNLFEK